ncbi:MAG: response regulator transcription factor [Hyphomicrobiales bacterium]|nr:response regulator transcription factor [Hyphomicrobiales bacterium]
MDYEILSESERAAVLLGFVAGMLMRLSHETQPIATDGVPEPALQLRAREQTIIALVGSGRSNKEIGRELGITPETVKFHLKGIFRKLNVHRRAEAVLRAQDLGVFSGTRGLSTLRTPGIDRT